jgi:hypothetical protein
MVDWSRWTTHPYYALIIFIVACGSIPKGEILWRPSLSLHLKLTDGGIAQVMTKVASALA